MSNCVFQPYTLIAGIFFFGVVGLPSSSDGQSTSVEHQQQDRNLSVDTDEGTVNDHEIDSQTWSDWFFERSSSAHEALTQSAQQAREFGSEYIYTMQRPEWPIIDIQIPTILDFPTENISDWLTGIYTSQKLELSDQLSSVSSWTRTQSELLYENLSSSVSDGTEYIVVRGRDGITIAYERTSEGIASTADWGQSQYSRLSQIDYCDMGAMDLVGGAAAGVAATSAFSGVNVTGAALLMIPTVSGWVPAIAVATSPAIATSVTLAAGAGVVLYATGKGYCWFVADEEGQRERVP